MRNGETIVSLHVEVITCSNNKNSELSTGEGRESLLFLTISNSTRLSPITFFIHLRTSSTLLPGRRRTFAIAVALCEITFEASLEWTTVTVHVFLIRALRVLLLEKRDEMRGRNNHWFSNTTERPKEAFIPMV